MYVYICLYKRIKIQVVHFTLGIYVVCMYIIRNVNYEHYKFCLALFMCVCLCV